MTQGKSRAASRFWDVVFFLAFAWVALAFFLALLGWQTAEPFAMSARILLLVVTLVGAAIGIVGIFWAIFRKP